MTYEYLMSNWHKWTERDTIFNIKCPGIYIVAKSKTNLSGQAFSWIAEIIYIGMSNSRGGLRSRLRQLDQTLQGKIKHGGADRILYKYRDYAALAPELYITILPISCNVESNQPKDLRLMGDILRLEFYCFAEFSERFSALPEFNDKKASPKFSLSS